MSEDLIDDVRKAVDNLAKEGQIWMTDWIRNNYALAQAFIALAFKMGSAYARFWLEDQYRRSRETTKVD